MYSTDGLSHSRGIADMPYFRCAASALRSTTISMRHFRPIRYRIRIFAYNIYFRSRPTEEVEVDFRSEVSLLVSFLQQI